MHLVFAMAAPIEQHKEFQKNANKKLYRFEGEERIGYNRPHVSEIKFYDIRVKEEVAPLFLRDIDAICPGQNDHHTQSIWHKSLNPKFWFWDKMVRFGLWLARRPMGLIDVKKADGPVDKIIQHWHYTYFIGAYENRYKKRGYKEEL